MNFLLRFFTWWNGQTMATSVYTASHGEFVGDDEFGNKYYRKPGIDPVLGWERRWVIYNGYADGSATPPGWYGWLHHTVDTPPTKEDYKKKEWETPFVPNMTGTPQAYRPQGSTLNAGARPQVSGDYEAWTP